MTKATYNGKPLNRGRLQIGKPYAEGYAILRCGGTEVKISYTVLHNCFHFSKLGDSSYFHAEMEQLRDAVDSIICEASVGNTGEPTNDK